MPIDCMRAKAASASAGRPALAHAWMSVLYLRDGGEGRG